MSMFERYPKKIVLREKFRISENCTTYISKIDIDFY